MDEKRWLPVKGSRTKSSPRTLSSSWKCVSASCELKYIVNTIHLSVGRLKAVARCDQTHCMAIWCPAARCRGIKLMLTLICGKMWNIMLFSLHVYTYYLWYFVTWLVDLFMLCKVWWKMFCKIEIKTATNFDLIWFCTFFISQKLELAEHELKINIRLRYKLA